MSEKTVFVFRHRNPELCIQKAYEMQSGAWAGSIVLADTHTVVGDNDLLDDNYECIGMGRVVPQITPEEEKIQL